MRRHGWSGNVPASDEEAIGRILDTVDSLAAEHGSAVRITDVARSLGVSRQTVYRYFPSPEALLAASRVRSADGLLERLAAHVRGLHDPATALVEGVAFALESLAGDQQVRRALNAQAYGSPATSFTSDLALTFGRMVLRRYDVDWTHHGFDSAALDELAELCLRTFHSLSVDPGRLIGDGIALRSFIARWLGPAVHHRQLSRMIDAIGPTAAPNRVTGEPASDKSA